MQDDHDQDASADHQALDAQLTAALQNDNLPVPENIPSDSDNHLDPTSKNPLKAKPVWDEDQTGEPPAICPRSKAGCEQPFIEAALLDYPDEPVSRSGLTYHFTPMQYWQQVVDWSNTRRPGLNLTVDELKVWWNLRRFMACYPGHNVSAWFSNEGSGAMNGAPFRLNSIMSGRRFKKITACLCFHDGHGNGYDVQSNKFFQELPKDRAWNDNMRKHYRPGQTITPDESMVFWLHRHACPGWTMCPRKPWPQVVVARVLACACAWTAC